MPVVFAFLTAFALTVILVPLVAQYARTRGMYAQPSSDRWHRRPVPKVGGIAMLPPLLLVCALSGLLPSLLPVLVGSSLMFVVGLVDDFRIFRPGTKLVLQTVAAAALLYLLPEIRITGSAIADFLLGFAWIIGITNAMNLLDNMDGLAAGVSLIAGACFLAVLYLIGAPAAEPLAVGMAAFVGITAGFLLFNFHPASIFMGDSGSHLLGSFLAGSALMATPAMSSHLAPVAAIPVVLLLRSHVPPPRRARHRRAPGGARLVRAHGARRRRRARPDRAAARAGLGIRRALRRVARAAGRLSRPRRGDPRRDGSDGRAAAVRSDRALSPLRSAPRHRADHRRVLSRLHRPLP
jgi:UDP-GlcNAc:undecaprenyl-phosphate GlcNAc-1-phosphate transferase